MSNDPEGQIVIIHAGFHKTGTTSVQAMIERERERLNVFAQFYVKSEIGPASKISRRYSWFPNRFTLAKFEVSFTRFLKTCQKGKPIVISRESLCGTMLTGSGRWPFRRDSYRRVPLNLAKAMVKSVRDVFGENARVTLLYTTRGDNEYIRSVYGHLLRDHDLCEDFDTFRRRFRRSINLQGTADKIAKALPNVCVKEAMLADISQSVRGPGQVILDLLGVPKDIQDHIGPPNKRNNPGISDELADQLLMLNRADIKSGERARAKKDLIVAERKALHGWRR
jgi:hypothetical protein